MSHRYEKKYNILKMLKKNFRFVLRKNMNNSASLQSTITKFHMQAHSNIGYDPAEFQTRRIYRNWYINQLKGNLKELTEGNHQEWSLRLKKN